MLHVTIQPHGKASQQPLSGRQNCCQFCQRDFYLQKLSSAGFPQLTTIFNRVPNPVSTMNLQVRRYSRQYFHSGMQTHASNYWMIFKATTPLNSSPHIVGHTRSYVRPFPEQGFLYLRRVQEPVTPPAFSDPRTGVNFKISKNFRSVVL